MYTAIITAMKAVLLPYNLYKEKCKMNTNSWNIAKGENI
jgi:hypothetical protein